ncbi:AAA family ATPase [uncultured Rikenella sp.]|uniref:AAA family ATPase n=1 Tax=uncultured Rikenella sp. TaxID=368003 RepID=UPI0025D11F02|nr:AAA family ATPase [uncultured Rikenella sp.]
MLVKFAVTHYRGFADRIEWDLSNPANYEFNPHVIKNGIIKNGILYGPNGSGKTNFSLALFDIVNHLSPNWKKPDYYMNFIHAGSPESVVDFEYEFRFERTKVRYTYSKNALGILVAEFLYVDDEMVFERKGKRVQINGQQFPMTPMAKKNLSNNNANNVSIVNFLLISYPLAKDHYLIRLKQFVDSMLWFRHLDTREFIGLDPAPTDNIDQFIITNNLLNDFATFLKEVSGQRFHFAKPKPGEKVIFCQVKEHSIPFHTIASTGTEALYLLYFWRQKIKNASFVFIDEFDAFYHFKLAFEICKRLFRLDCQVFTSSHNTYLMTNELLRPDCNFILRNNTIKPLNECTDKELRFGHNIEKIYRANAFNL